jgi:predicted MPP superfamily phosphohydrolase
MFAGLLTKINVIPRPAPAGHPATRPCPAEHRARGRRKAWYPPRTMDTLFRWIHLSDIHTGHGDRTYGWDQALVLDEIVRDIDAQRRAQPEPPIDAILVTGDIANTGAGRTPTEYATAAAWLGKVAAAAGVSTAQIYVVPGNHDVDRGADKDEAVKQLVTDLREGRKSLDDALAEAAPRALLARRMARYLDFAGAFAPVGATADDRIHWVHRLVAPSGLAVRLVGLNTTLLAAGDDDQGKLRVGMRQIAMAFAELQESELVLALGHHPLGGGWLFDQPEIEPFLKRHAHALLTGHVHVANAEESRSGAGSTFLRVVAGSAHGDRMPAGAPAGHGYSFGAIVRGGDGVLHAQITPRKWSAPNAMFRPDVDNVPEHQAHSDHPLRRIQSLPGANKPSSPLATSTPPPVKIPPGGPIPAFISVARGDDGARVELQNHLVQLRRSKKIVFKHSQEAPVGDGEAAWIAERIDEARIVFLLISQEYIASDAYYEEQLLRAVERHGRGEVTIVPILLSPYRFSDEPFAGLVFLPKRPVGGKLVDEAVVANKACPVDQYPGGRDKAFEGIAQEVRAIVEGILAGATASAWK